MPPLPTAPPRAPRSCKGWPQEAALPMLRTDLDPGVGERPDEPIVYGGTGKAGRNRVCLEAIVASLQRLDRVETLLVVLTGDPGIGIIRHVDAGYPEAMAAARTHILPMPMLETTPGEES